MATKRTPKNGYSPPKSEADKPFVPSGFTLPEAYAIQALERGEATPEQQVLALTFIINKICKTYDVSYRPDSERDTTFAEGKRFCGLQLVSIIKRNLSIYQPEKE